MSRVGKALAVVAVVGSVAWVGRQVVRHHYKSARLHAQIDAVRSGGRHHEDHRDGQVWRGHHEDTQEEQQVWNGSAQPRGQSEEDWRQQYIQSQEKQEQSDQVTANTSEEGSEEVADEPAVGLSKPARKGDVSVEPADMPALEENDKNTQDEEAQPQDYESSLSDSEKEELRRLKAEAKRLNCSAAKAAGSFVAGAAFVGGVGYLRRKRCEQRRQAAAAAASEAGERSAVAFV
eukprot:TRINITY_DN14874_c0_g1_i1.p1 TRINITY_DN14874_c0_g1~~TRINITY_DN14874_c0_g1_i1.p1  ORF type:complete len:233 (+),score=75.80 TRINITY_DN14874_c0_g1_i1:139-837(+)